MKLLMPGSRDTALSLKILYGALLLHKLVTVTIIFWLIDACTENYAFHRPDTFESQDIGMSILFSQKNSDDVIRSKGQ